MNNGEGKIHPFAERLEAIGHLAAEAEKSLSVMRSKNFLGIPIIWLAKKFGKIPEWAKHHIEITKQLESAVKELNALQQTTIPPNLLKDVPTTKQLQERLKQLEAENQIIPLEIIKTLQDCQSTMAELSKMNYAHFLEITRASKADKTYADPHRLLVSKSSKPIDSFRMEWHLNLGLLMNIYKRTNDPELKKKLSFLALNYLAKAAPINIKQLGLDREMTARLEDLFQFGLFQMISYHREVSTFEGLVLKEINNTLASWAQEGPLVLTDTTDISILLPTKFSLLSTNEKGDEQIQESWKNDLTDLFIKHFDQHGDSIDRFKDFLVPPVVLDLTKLIGDIQTGEDEGINRGVEAKFTHYETLMDQAVSEAVQKMKSARPDLVKSEEDEKQLEVFVRSNLICISTTSIKGVGCVKVLPMFYKQEFYEKYCPVNQNAKKFFLTKMGEKGAFAQVQLNDMVNLTGIRLGGVRGREQIFNFLDLETMIAQAPDTIQGYGRMVEYAEIGPNSLYFADKSDFINSALFSRLEKCFAEPEALKSIPPHARVLGKSALQLIKGLLNELDEQKWIALNANADTRQIIQTTLFRLMQHLGNAESSMDDFKKFTQAIELVHCELATLLSVASPFKEENFSQIYQEHQLDFIPQELASHVKAGVSKSAMNAFAGINAAIKSQQPDLQRVYGECSYFEEVQFIGANRSTQEVLQNPSINRIDLYVGEFNHNISINPEHNEYQVGDIIGEVDALLKAKPDTKQLTIAVDCTIDYIHSSKAEALLKHFSKQIQEGKLNFVFFRSGQKFDMLGMDNYYGGIFYMVNNGGEQWKPFNNLISHEAYQTDPLSMQWFCLVNKYAPKATDAYRQQIFENTRKILDRIPQNLKPGGNTYVKVCTVAENMDPCFIDIKLLGKKLTQSEVEQLLHQTFDKYKTKVHSRSSFGFYHPNINFIRGLEGGINIRINPGLDPKEVGILAEFFQTLSNRVEMIESE